MAPQGRRRAFAGTARDIYLWMPGSAAAQPEIAGVWAAKIIQPCVIAP